MKKEDIAVKRKKKAEKASAKKRAKVVVPKIDYLCKPENMSLEEWQIALRRQQVDKENFIIDLLGEKYK